MESNKPNGYDGFVVNKDCHGPPQMDIATFIQNTLEDLKISREHEVCLQNSLKVLMDKENFGVNQKWFELRGKYLKALKLNEFLLRTFVRRVEEFQNERKVLEEKYRSEIEDLKSKLERSRIDFEAKEAEFHNELELVRAATVVQRDETESNLKRQLVDANSRARNQQNEIRNLNLEIQNLRSRLSSKQIFSDLSNNVLIFNPTMNPQTNNLDTLFEEKLREKFSPRMDLDRKDGTTSRYSMTSTVSLGENQLETNNGPDLNFKAEDPLKRPDLLSFPGPLYQEGARPAPAFKSTGEKFRPLNIFTEPKGPSPKVAKRRPRAAVPPLLPCTVSTAKNVEEEGDMGEASVKRKRRKLYNPSDYIY